MIKELPDIADIAVIPAIPVIPVIAAIALQGFLICLCLRPMMIAIFHGKLMVL